jgi:tetratricopeptide (TPR) repeat protein
MISHPLACLGAAVLATATLTAPAFSQAPAAPAAPAADTKLELEDKAALDAGTVKLDPALPAATIPGRPAAPAAAVVPPLPGLEKLTPAQRQAAAKGIADVTSYMRGVRLQESLEKLNEVEGVTGDFHIVSNMRGAVFTKMRDFKAARAEFEKAIVLTKNMPRENFHPRFNLAEINFVEKNWPQARTEFTELLASSNVPDSGTRRLMEYKIFICHLQEKQANAADSMLEKFDQYDNDSPAYYFAMAATSFAKEKKEEAEEWLASASKIYPKEINDVYQDSLVEVGWLQTLQ